MLLIDTNIWLELLLEQDKANEVKLFLKRVNPSEFFITEFSVYSIGIIMTKLGQDKAYLDFLADTLENSGISRISLSIEDIKKIPRVIKRFRLDFDDAYQYVAAEEFALTLVSFDSDFDRTDKRRKTPAQFL